MSLSFVRDLLARTSRLVDRVALWGAYLAAAGIFFIAALVTVSSLRRYLLNSPIPETEELGGLLFLATTFLALPYGLSRGRHVRLELLWRFLPAPWRNAFSLLGYLLAIVALAMLIRVTWVTAISSWEMGNRSVMTEIVLWPWRMLMPLSLGVMLAAMVLRFVGLGIRVARGEIEDSYAPYSPSAEDGRGPP